MEKTQTSLHPLLTAAAISVTVLSAVAVATLTGLIPSSQGSPKPAAPVVQTAPALQAAKPAQIPAAKPVRKSTTPRSVAPHIVKVAELNLGTVQAVRQIETKSDGRSGVGAIGGGIAGAVIGNRSAGAPRAMC